MKRLTIWVLILMLIVPSALAGAPPEYRMVANPDPADRLNLRAAPSREADSLGKYFSGVLVEVIEDDGGDWLRVRIGTTEGYMMRRYLSNAVTAQVAPMTVMTTVNNSYAPVQALLSAPGSDAIVLAQIMNGTQAIILGYADTMAHVQVGGVTGYMPQACLTQSPAAPPSASALPSGTLAGATLALDGESFTLTDSDALARLSGMLAASEYAGYAISGCPFTAELTLSYADGTSAAITLATDSCCVFRLNGYDYRYARSMGAGGSSPDNALLFDLFGATLPLR